MNNNLKEWLRSRPSGYPELSHDFHVKFQAGLGIFATYVSEDFFDIQEQPMDRMDVSNQDGYYYSIPYFHGDSFSSHSGEIPLLYVLRVKDRGFFYPLRFDFNATVVERDRVDFWIKVYDQTGSRTTSRELAYHEKGVNYTMIPDHDKMKLSDFIKEVEPGG
ncbi:hypothetical protein PUW25_25620 (plasmid) [Paenibacillus urinalis]|uniref:Uncharacterized protein n=1 Tax=Paenibacillus urinalis TaxID=521520 RepID=A0ABY7XHA5_9BACL|nr:hypothetical protein [Paenibacillus urinalis]WDI05191.1 hypothetical protein PUW25_25620 [Paenibacillus urinalis]